MNKDKTEGVTMTDDILIFDEGETKALLDPDLDLIVLTSQPLLGSKDTLLITVSELDAIHTALHADDEPMDHQRALNALLLKATPDNLHGEVKVGNVAKQATCGSCKYFQGHSFDDDGFCHFLPPDMDIVVRNHSRRPPVAFATVGCGEHKEKIDE